MGYLYNIGVNTYREGDRCIEWINTIWDSIESRGERKF